NTPAAGALHLLQEPFSLLTDGFFGLVLGKPGGMDGGTDFLLRNLPLLGGGFHQPVGGDFFTGEGDKGADVMDVSFGDGFYVVFQVFGVGNHNGAVEVVLGFLGFLMFVEYTGMEN